MVDMGISKGRQQVKQAVTRGNSMCYQAVTRGSMRIAGKYKRIQQVVIIINFNK